MTGEGENAIEVVQAGHGRFDDDQRMGAAGQRCHGRAGETGRAVDQQQRAGPLFGKAPRRILRSYEKEIFQIDSARFIHYLLTNQIGEKSLLPRFIELLPIGSAEPVLPYSHEGEEFVYVLEGVLTLFIENEQHELFPGDSAHYPSTTPHNWANYTSKMVRLLVVSTPNPFPDKGTGQ